jgi:4-hydroxybenzoate polyprenyltransferase
MSVRHIYYLGLMIALSTSSMSTVFSVLFLSTISIPLFFCIFLATYTFYAIDRVVGIEIDKVSHPDRSRFLNMYRTEMYIIILLAIVGSISITVMVSIQLALLVALALPVALLYSGGLSRGSQMGHAFGIKRVPFLKDVFIAGGWTFLLPFTFIFQNAPMKTEHWFFAVPLFLKLFVMAVIYDYKDIDSDMRSGVRTLPTIMGENRTKTILHLLNSIATVLILILIGLGAISVLGMIFVPAFFYQGLNIQLLHRDAPDWVYYVLADLEQFFWLVYIVLWGWILEFL